MREVPGKGEVAELIDRQVPGRPLYRPDADQNERDCEQHADQPGKGLAHQAVARHEARAVAAEAPSHALDLTGPGRTKSVLSSGREISSQHLRRDSLFPEQALGKRLTSKQPSP